MKRYRKPAMTTTRKAPKVSNTNARGYVQNLKEFYGSNTFAQWETSMGIPAARYVVYSYGQHWPMFIYDVQTERWFENASKFSVSTSKQHSQMHPRPDVPTTLLHVEDMCKVAADGAVALIKGV